ncbi:MAG TPA: 7-carboxy-7-deazaguanine synthase QueE [Gammaproteobacteria bacterium]|nr:7-carboxy-7-deazaguanine synthase QueE [Gammaproteobacteria bacterium]
MNETSGPMRSLRRDELPPAERLRLTEIFLSIQGEAASVGWPTVFVRLTGCPLRCRWCDTAYAFHGGEWRSFDAIEAEVARYAVSHVCITGGEPLAQANCRGLVARLAAAGYAISIETSGALPIAGLDPRAIIVMDVKTPGSGEVSRNRLENLEQLRARDQAKFVLAERGDYEWAREFLREHDLAARCEVLFSPVAGELAPRALAEWILADRLPVRFQLQLHKLLWGDVPGH